MRIWIKLLAGSALGIALAVVAGENELVYGSLPWLERFALAVGRYALVPALFFSIAIGVHDLRKEGRFWSLMLRNAAIAVALSAFVVAAGLAATVAFDPGRIPVMAVEQDAFAGFDVAGAVMDLFPGNMFAALAGDGSFLLPIYVFAFFLGVGLSYDKGYSKRVVEMVDSLSRIFSHVMSFFVEMLGFVMIALSASWAIRFRGAWAMEAFGEFMLMLGALAALLGFGILPLFLYLVRPKANPWLVLYGSIGPAIAAFFSGDVHFSMPALMRHAKESLGIRRRSSAPTLAALGAFCRGGSAMVAAASFVLVFNSYSGIGISAAEIVSIGASALLVSFMLARHPGGGAYIALAALCAGFGRGFEEGFLILRPIAFYLIAVGAFLDAMMASIANYASARLGGFVEDRGARQHI